MTMPEKNIMVEKMILKNPDSTIIDFVEALKEIESIEMFACEKMPDPRVLREMKKILKGRSRC